ncbi:hypothetical protein LINGRAHAP2_LOCUS33678, partial [Linum grandiflorum]
TTCGLARDALNMRDMDGCKLLHVGLKMDLPVSTSSLYDAARFDYDPAEHLVIDQARMSGLTIIITVGALLDQLSTFFDSPGTNPMTTVLMLGRYEGIKILAERGYSA